MPLAVVETKFKLHCNLWRACGAILFLIGERNCSCACILFQAQIFCLEAKICQQIECTVSLNTITVFLPSLTSCLFLFMNLTAWAEDLSESFLGDSPPSLSGEKRLFRLLPESAAIELRLLESDSSLLSSSLFLLACKWLSKKISVTKWEKWCTLRRQRDYHKTWQRWYWKVQKKPVNCIGTMHKIQNWFDGMAKTYFQLHKEANLKKLIHMQFLSSVNMILKSHERVTTKQSSLLPLKLRIQETWKNH